MDDNDLTHTQANAADGAAQDRQCFLRADPRTDESRSSGVNNHKGLNRDWLAEYDCPPQAADPSAYLHHLYEENKCLIFSMARRYSKLGGCVVSEEDLKAEGYIAVDKAFRKYDPDRGAKFSSYLFFHLQKTFQAAVGSEDRFAELFKKDEDDRDEFVGTMGYLEYQKKKKQLQKSGVTGTVKNRMVEMPDGYLDRIADDKPYSDEE